MLTASSILRSRLKQKRQSLKHLFFRAVSNSKEDEDEDNMDPDLLYMNKQTDITKPLRYRRTNGIHMTEDSMAYPSPRYMQEIENYTKNTPMHAQLGDKLRRILLARKWREAKFVTNDKKAEKLAIWAEELGTYDAFQKVLDEGEMFAPDKTDDYFESQPDKISTLKLLEEQAAFRLKLNRAHGYISENFVQFQEVKLRKLRKDDDAKAALQESGLALSRAYEINENNEEEQEDDIIEWDDDGNPIINADELIVLGDSDEPTLVQEARFLKMDATDIEELKLDIKNRRIAEGLDTSTSDSSTDSDRSWAMDHEFPARKKKTEDDLADAQSRMAFSDKASSSSEDSSLESMGDASYDEKWQQEKHEAKVYLKHLDGFSSSGSFSESEESISNRKSRTQVGNSWFNRYSEAESEVDSEEDILDWESNPARYESVEGKLIELLAGPDRNNDLDLLTDEEERYRKKFLAKKGLTNFDPIEKPETIAAYGYKEAKIDVNKEEIESDYEYVIKNLDENDREIQNLKPDREGIYWVNGQRPPQERGSKELDSTKKLKVMNRYSSASTSSLSSSDDPDLKYGSSSTTEEDDDEESDNETDELIEEALDAQSGRDEAFDLLGFNDVLHGEKLSKVETAKYSVEQEYREFIERGGNPRKFDYEGKLKKMWEDLGVTEYAVPLLKAEESDDHRRNAKAKDVTYKRYSDDEYDESNQMDTRDGWNDPEYDISEFVVNDETKLTYEELQERIAKEEMDDRVVQDKLEKMCDYSEDELEHHMQRFLVMDLPEDRQRAMLGLLPKPRKDLFAKAQEKLKDPSGEIIQEWKRDYDLNQKEFNFYKHDWMPQDGLYVDGKKTSLEKVYHGEENYLFHDEWEKDSEYRNEADYEIGGRIKKNKGDGPEFENRKTFYDAIAAEIQKRLRLDQGPPNQMEERMRLKRLYWLERDARGVQYTAKRDNSGNTEASGGRKTSKASVILRPVRPCIPKGASENSESFGETNLIPLPRVAAESFKECIAKVNTFNGFGGNDSDDDKKSKNDAAPVEKRKTETVQIFESMNFEAVHKDISLTPYLAPPKYPTDSTFHFHEKEKKSRSGGMVTINGLPFSKYFPDYLDRHTVLAPLIVVGVLGEYDIECKVNGGGNTGQAEALRLAIARALVKQDPIYRKASRVSGFLTRDSRVVERKKPGHKKARKSFTWVKR